MRMGVGKVGMRSRRVLICHEERAPLGCVDVRLSTVFARFQAVIVTVPPAAVVVVAWVVLSSVFLASSLAPRGLSRSRPGPSITQRRQAAKAAVPLAPAGVSGANKDGIELQRHAARSHSGC